MNTQTQYINKMGERVVYGGRLYFSPPPGFNVVIGKYVIVDKPIVVWPIDQIHLAKDHIYSVSAINVVQKTTTHGMIEYPHKYETHCYETTEFALFNKIALVDFAFSSIEDASKAIRASSSNIQYAKHLMNDKLLHIAMSRGLDIRALPRPLDNLIIYAHIDKYPALAAEYAGRARAKLIDRSMLSFKYLRNTTYAEALQVATKTLRVFRDHAARSRACNEQHPLETMPREFLTPELINAAIEADPLNCQFMGHLELAPEQLERAFNGGLSIRFLRDPTPAQRSTAIVRDWREIAHVRDPTPDECAIAISASEGAAIKRFNMTPELFCELFKRQFKGILQLCAVQTPELIEAAVRARPSNVLEVREPSISARMLAIEMEPALIGSIEQTQDLAIAAVARDHKTIRLIKEKFIEPCIEYLRATVE